MFLTSLQIERFRSLDHVDIELVPGLNVFVGENGAGKTSILEAVSFLGTGRSFLTPRYQHLIQHQAQSTWVAGRLSLEQESVPLGIERRLDGGVTARISGQPVSGLSQLARQLPYLVIGAEGLSWLAGSPQRRRSLLDWGVFHVLGTASGLFQRYRKALDQRNRALKNDKISNEEITAWDEVLAESGEQIVALRAQYFEAFKQCLTTLFAQHPGLPALELAYRPGYSVDKGGLRDALHRGLGRDRLLGSTQSGPHRGDFVLNCRGVAASDALSRGQQKVLVAMMVLAQQRLLLQQQARHVILLVDDLAAELDDQRQRSCWSKWPTRVLSGS